MNERRGRSRIFVAVVAVLILALGVYGPIALLAPLPAAEVGELELPASAPANGPLPPLPVEGSSGLVLGAEEAPVSAGDSAVPMAAAAKIVTALVVLDAEPLEAGRSGPNIPVTTEDYASYMRYAGEGTRSIRVVTGDTWTEREVLHAMLIASSNNHAEMLARWAFGTLDAYLDAADTWLEKHGLMTIEVADATGLSAASVGTGADLARLAALAMDNPFIAEAVTIQGSTTTRGADFENTIRYRPDDGIVGISRSYTDEAGVCLLFALPVTVGDSTVTVYGAFLGEPSYDQLGADMDALLDAAPQTIGERELVAADTPAAGYRTAWGATSLAVTDEALTGIGWLGAPSTVTAVVATEPRVTARAGTVVGEVRVTVAGRDETLPLRLARSLSDPGPLWRLANPGIVVPQFFGGFAG